MKERRKEKEEQTNERKKNQTKIFKNIIISIVTVEAKQTVY